MSETIPPSLVVLISIGSSAGVSIAGLFTGGLLPAAVGALALVVIVRLRAGRDRPGERASLAVMLRSFVIALPVLALPFLIRAAVVEGVATATEVSTVGIAYTIVTGLLLYRRGSWARVYPMLLDTASLAWPRSPGFQLAFCDRLRSETETPASRRGECC